MHRDKGRRRTVRVILMAVLLALAVTGVTFGLTHAEAAADWVWMVGPHR